MIFARQNAPLKKLQKLQNNACRLCRNFRDGIFAFCNIPVIEFPAVFLYIIYRKMKRMGLPGAA